MSKFQQVPEGKDPILWDIAQRRASFKKHAFTYLIINAFLWAIWYFTGPMNTANADGENYPWPMWTSLGWGLGLAIHYAGAYMFPRATATEQEYEKLKNKQL